MEKKEIAELKLHVAKPTIFKIGLLHEWVVWQFPKKHPTATGFCGAVHPPLEKYGWFPAIVQPDKNEVHIYGHIPEPFESPEQAADFFVATKNSVAKAGN
ncbi:hypothetical protein [Candidatus Leptofilum sp.]|uniref:hypothetical protein n=1 Tax=Candidatus Leptofilum sp. TaxID=3241576 RepID=UPI003B5A5B77